MSLDHLDKLALAAGYAAVADDDEPTATVPARLRYRTPDAPEPRTVPLVPSALAQVAFTPVPALPAAAATARHAVTTAVGTAIKTAQGLVGLARAPA